MKRVITIGIVLLLISAFFGLYYFQSAITKIPVKAIDVVVILVSGAIISVFSVFLTFAYEDFGNPKYKISILNPELIGGDIYLRLLILNSPSKFWPFITRKTSNSCHGTLTFFSNKYEQYMCEEARWTGNPEPIRLDADRTVILEPSLLRMSRFIDIAADEREAMDICFRPTIGRDAYLWNSDSYIPTAATLPERRIRQDKSFFELKLKDSFGVYKYYFIINNPENIRDFEIVEIDLNELREIKEYLPKK